MDIVHTSIILDTRRALKDGTFPVKLRLTFQRQRKYYLTIYTLKEEEFAKSKAEKPKGRFKDLDTAFSAIEQKAITILKDLPSFTFEAFEKKFLSTRVVNDVFSAFTEQKQKLTKEGRVGSASSYNDAFISLLSFVNKSPTTRNKGITIQDVQAKREELLKNIKPLSFSAITPEFLYEYETWMLGSGKSLTTVGIYARSLRAIINNAIAAGEMNKEDYPFGKRKYQIPAGRNTKKALPLNDIEKIFFYEPSQTNEARNRDYWMLSYLSNGANVKDIARLKYKRLSPETINFIRAKTERTTRGNQKIITVIRTPEIDEIIERWGNKPVSLENYVFPILSDGLTPEQELAKVRQTIKNINNTIKKIAAKVGIVGNISTYTARHSFATILKRAGASTGFIKDALGHGTDRTTENYLDSFEDELKKQFANQLTAFKPKN